MLQGQAQCSGFLHQLALPGNTVCLRYLHKQQLVALLMKQGGPWMTLMGGGH